MRFGDAAGHNEPNLPRDSVIPLLWVLPLCGILLTFIFVSAMSAGTGAHFLSAVWAGFFCRTGGLSAKGSAAHPN